jgi:hypothetical protein
MDTPPTSPTPASSSSKKKEKSGTASSSSAGSGGGGGGSGSSGSVVPVFPVGPAGKRELRRALVKSTDPAKTISTFQQRHSLHSMVARAFGTTPSYEYRATRKNSTVVAGAGGLATAAAAATTATMTGTAAAPARKTVETLDTDSVMTFLSHLGVRQHEVHKRISDTLMKALIDEVRKSGAGVGGGGGGGNSGTMSSAHKDRLLDLLKSCWMYATTIPELRPVLWAVLKQLGEVCVCPSGFSSV